MEPGDRGTLETRSGRNVVQGFFVPKELPAAGSTASRRGLKKSKVIELDSANGELRIFPTNTRRWNDGFLGPKYKQIVKITLTVDADEDTDLRDILEDLPSGLTKDFEYGLGLAQECEPIIDFIEKNTGCTTLELATSGETAVRGKRFRLSLSHLDDLRGELTRISSRGQGGIARVKETLVHNDLAPALGLENKTLTLGRLTDSRWIAKVAAGMDPLNEDEQDELLAAAVSAAPAIAVSSPQKIARLQRDIERVGLEQLIETFQHALTASHGEDWWQEFFEMNVFLLQLVFGGPTVFINSQVPIGEGGNAPKGKKIADYLFKNSMTNNAALVEIKKPSTRLLRKRPYRQGVYGVDAEIGQAVTQVLDQALQLLGSEADTKKRTADSSWVVNAPRCFVVAGRASELDTADKRKSFDLYREHLAGVRLVTYDEIFQQLKLLGDFLASDTESDSGGI